MNMKLFSVVVIAGSLLSACVAAPSLKNSTDSKAISTIQSSGQPKPSLSKQQKKTLIASLFKATREIDRLNGVGYTQPWMVKNLKFSQYFTSDLIAPMQNARRAFLNTTYGYCDKDVLGGQDVGESLTIFEPDADGNVQAATYYAKGLELYTPILFVFEGNKIKDIRRMDHEAEANYQTRQIKPIDVKLFSKETLKEKIARSEACLKLPEPR